MEEVDELWKSGGLGDSSPSSLLHTVWWLNSIHLGMRGVREHHTLCWGDITMKTASNGLRYLENNERQTKMRTGDV